MVCGMTFQGKADVHKTLISANVVHNKSMLQLQICDIFHISFKNETVNDPGAIRLHLENGTYIGYTKIQQHVRTRSDQELCSMHAEQHLRRPSARSVGEGPMVSVVVKLTAALLRNRQRQSCKPVRNLALLERLCKLKTRLWMQRTDDEAIEVQRPTLLRSDVDRPSWRSNTMLRLDMPSIELGVMRARTREIAWNTRDGSLVERTRTRTRLSAIDYGYLKLDGAEDEDDDEYDESCTEQSCSSWFANVVKTGIICCNLFVKGRSE